MSRLTRYRVRWIENAGIALAEKRHVKWSFLFWKGYEWEAVARFPTTQAGFAWLVDTYGAASPTPNADEGEV